jgi:diguanylate cyclase (GGDEF)-like protein
MNVEPKNNFEGKRPNENSAYKGNEDLVDKLVYLVTSAPLWGANLAQQINHFGYQVQIVDGFGKLENAVAQHKAIAVLVDIIATKDESAASEIFQKLENLPEKSIPIMFLSDYDDQIYRLNAIRSGGVAFFSKPIDIVSLIDKLDEMRVSGSFNHRVLIIEDQPTVANYYQMILRMAGMSTRIVIDPMLFLAEIDDFNPDLVLMDLYLPSSNGIELSKMIRQIEKYVSIPIVFLSSEDDFAIQMEAMSLGGDDFLTKPIKADHLVSMVKSRLERLLILRSLMIRDSLTGLLNHTSIREHLKQEIDRCKRVGYELSLAMLDLDHFKTVNDSYGHAVGDSVLKSLSRLLRQRLRKSDIIGRYGGEEFVAILLNTNVNQAYAVMDIIREHFSQIEHYSPEKGVFSVNFSCGIASYPQFTNATTISDAADKALYAAKNAGRNQVMLAK